MIEKVQFYFLGYFANLEKKSCTKIILSEPQNGLAFCFSFFYTLLFVFKGAYDCFAVLDKKTKQKNQDRIFFFTQKTSKSIGQNKAMILDFFIVKLVGEI